MVWAPHWLIGTYKHPPLPSWIIELSVILTRDVILGPYLAAQLSVALTYWFLYQLGRLLMDPIRAAAGTALIAASYYFTVPTIEFNHNIVQLPLWAGTILIYAHLRRDPTSLLKWTLLGLICAIGLYAKYSFALLIGVLLITSLIEKPMRMIWLSPGPYLAGLLTLILFTPHLVWLFKNNFEPFSYLAARADSSSASSPLKFFLTQIADHLPMIVPILFAGIGSLKSATHDMVDRKDRLFLRLVTFMPLGFTLVFAVLTNSRIKDMWGLAMFTPLGLLVVMELGRAWTLAMARRSALAASGLIVLVGLSFALHAYFVFGGNTPRTNWPMDAIASDTRALWARSAPESASLAIIGGTPWIAGLAAINTPLRNQVIIGEKLDHSPWISAEDLKTKGAILLFSGVRENAPALCSGPIVKDILKTRTPDGQQITAFMCLPSS